MDLRCLVCSSDTETAAPICQVLAELGAEAEQCPEGAAAAARIASESFHIVIVDWDQQAEAELILKAARGRKANERPLALAVVSDDSKFPKALQAGANSILRKPVLINQVKESLQAARSLLKARQGSTMAMAASASASPATIAVEPPGDAHLRAGEFLQSTGPAPASQIDTESEMQKSIDQAAAANVQPVKDLEPTASEVRPEAPPIAPPADSGEPRGLQWYLKNRGVPSPYVLSHAEAQTPSAQAPAAQNPEKAELLGFDQPPSPPAPKPSSEPQSAPTSGEQAASEQKAEAELFAYISEGGGTATPQASGTGFWLGKKAILWAAALAAVAVAAAPQAPWRPQISRLWSHGRQSIHSWLNPQPVSPPQAPPSHENFGRAGDEYKLPVAETIPDATTDPSQIRVTPVIDPTAKKPNPAATADPNAAPADATPANAADPSQLPPPPPADPGAATTAPASATQGNPAPASTAPAPTPAATGPTGAGTSNPPAAIKVPPAIADNTRPDPFASAAPASSVPVLAPPKNPQPRPVSPNSNPHIPSSLQSQLAPTTNPDASANKSLDTSLPSIEPVDLPEATERGLLNGQPAIAYPASAKGQQGTVVLLVLVGRDGTIQDAKFLQGSLAFARAAIDGVKQWTFKPYSMNGRPVSVQTKLTLTFRPGQ